MVVVNRRHLNFIKKGLQSAHKVVFMVETATVNDWFNHVYINERLFIIEKIHL